MFDEQRDIIFEAIDKQLELLRGNHPELRVVSVFYDLSSNVSRLGNERERWRKQKTLMAVQ
jgi:hypothetical protein